MNPQLSWDNVQHLYDPAGETTAAQNFLDKILKSPCIWHFSHFFILILSSRAIILFSSPPSYYYLSDPGRGSIISSSSTCFMHRSVYRNVEKNHHPANTFSVRSSNSVTPVFLVNYLFILGDSKVQMLHL